MEETMSEIMTCKIGNYDNQRRGWSGAVEIAMTDRRHVPEVGQTFSQQERNGHRPMPAPGASDGDGQVAPSFAFELGNKKTK